MNRRNENSLGNPIAVRLPGELERQLQADAESAKITLSAHIRVLLEKSVNRLSGRDAGYSQGFEEGIRQGLGQAKQAIVKAVSKLWPK